MSDDEHTVYIRMPQELFDLVAAAAKREDRSIASYIRSVLRKETGR